jgi:hypothetical protein
MWCKRKKERGRKGKEGEILHLKDVRLIYDVFAFELGDFCSSACPQDHLIMQQTRYLHVVRGNIHILNTMAARVHADAELCQSGPAVK